MQVRLPYGDHTLTLDVSPESLMGVYSPREVAAVANVAGEVRRALANPIQSSGLGQLAQGKRNAVIVADDITRLTPTDVIVPLLLDELNVAGITDDKITVVVALGTHRFMTDKEILAKFGSEVVRRVKVKNHPYRDPNSLIELGTTQNGTPISINREVYEADFKIGVGSIVPHHIPGFAGGAKIVQPGISGEATTAQTHLLSVRETRSYLGVVDNPVRRELNVIARKIGLNTILNTVLNREGKVVRAFFGDVVAAFEEGVQEARNVYAVELPAEADIVLAGSHPCDIEFWQAHKTLYAADRAVRRGGIIIVVTPCYEGVAKTHAEMVNYAGLTPVAVRQLFEEGRISDGVAAALAIAWGQVRQRADVYFVSDGITSEDIAKLSFVPFISAQEALDDAFRRLGPKAKLAVLTHAPDMLPIVAK